MYARQLWADASIKRGERYTRERKDRAFFSLLVTRGRQARSRLGSDTQTTMLIQVHLRTRGGGDLAHEERRGMAQNELCGCAEVQKCGSAEVRKCGWLTKSDAGWLTKSMRNWLTLGRGQTSDRPGERHEFFYWDLGGLRHAQIQGKLSSRMCPEPW